MEQFSLKAIRVMKNATAEDMAKLLGVSVQCYYQKERGERGLTGKELLKILDFAKISHKQIKL